jgi:hypothetical protein
VSAAGVGFVPSSRLWFSSLVFPPKEFTNIYTVIINNNYFYLDAIIGFYVDEKLIDTAYINHLSKEQATQVKGSWWPTEGSHAVAVRFVKAIAIDENGNQKELNVQEFNTVNSSAIQVGDSQSVKNSTSSADSSDDKIAKIDKINQDDLVAPVLNLKVEKNGDKLAIVEIKSSSASSTQNEELKKAVENKLQTAVQQGEDIRNKFVSTWNTMTSTIQTVGSLYDKTKSLFGDKDKYWQSIKTNEVFSKDFFQKIRDWVKPQNNLTILTWIFRSLFFILLFYFVIRFFRRRHRTPDDF